MYKQPSEDRQKEWIKETCSHQVVKSILNYRGRMKVPAHCQWSKCMPCMPQSLRKKSGKLEQRRDFIASKFKIQMGSCRCSSHFTRVTLVWHRAWNRGTLTSLRWFTPNRSFVFQALWTGVLQAGVYLPISRLERINDQWSAHFSFCDVLQLIRPFLNQNSQSKLLFLFVPGAKMQNPLWSSSVQRLVF